MTDESSVEIDRVECPACGHDDQGEMELIANDGRCVVCDEVLDDRYANTPADQEGKR